MAERAFEAIPRKCIGRFPFARYASCMRWRKAMRATYAVERFTESPRIRCSVSIVANMANIQHSSLCPWSFTGVVFSNISILGSLVVALGPLFEVHEHSVANATSVRIILFMRDKDTIFS